MKKSIAYMALALLTLSAWGCGGGGSSPFEGTASTTTPTTPTTPTTGVEVQAGGVLGPFIDIGDLGNDPLHNWLFSEGLSINEAGQIVGSSLTHPLSMVWDPTTPTTVFRLGAHVVDPLAIPLVYKSYDAFYTGATTNPLIYSTGIKTLYTDTDGDTVPEFIAIGNSSTSPDMPNDEMRAFFVRDGNFVDLAPITEGSAPNVFDSITAFSRAVDVNENGYVILTVDTATEGKLAYYWDGSTMVPGAAPDGSDIPYLSPLSRIFGQEAEAVAISPTTNLAVVNSGSTSVFNDIDSGFSQTIGTFVGDTSSSAVDINDRGQVVGISGSFGYLWEAGSMVRINSLGGSSCTPVAINNNSQVIGDAQTAGGSTHAFFWQLDGTGTPVITDLGTLGGANSHAVAINSNGWVVGYSQTGGTIVDTNGVFAEEHAFLWVNGVMYDLGVHNDFYDYPFIDSYPFSRATGINDAGQVVGNSISTSGNSRTFVLTPVFPPVFP